MFQWISDLFKRQQKELTCKDCYYFCRTSAKRLDPVTKEITEYNIKEQCSKFTVDIMNYKICKVFTED